ncbi:MAG: site-specific DNA-methyltransferase [Actinomycetota bacterium]|nr:site-specific DNA-methyltransferase [Actinomycetota bacterium]
MSSSESSQLPNIDLSNCRDLIIGGDAAQVLDRLPAGGIDLIYVDPPFNTGSTQRLASIKAEQDASSSRTGFGGRKYKTTLVSSHSYRDSFDDYLGFLVPLLEKSFQLLSSRGSLYVHLDYREVHYVKVELDKIFGRTNFMNEIIWAYDFGGRSKQRWPAKHDTILLYAKEFGKHIFNYEEIERIPYMAPGLVTKEKASRGKVPTDVWWQTIVHTTGRERTGYPTQKPEAILKRIVEASSTAGSWVLDFFAGSGTTACVSQQLGRRFIAIDSNPQAINIIKNRLDMTNVQEISC